MFFVIEDQTGVEKEEAESILNGLILSCIDGDSKVPFAKMEVSGLTAPSDLEAFLKMLINQTETLLHQKEPIRLVEDGKSIKSLTND